MSAAARESRSRSAASSDAKIVTSAISSAVTMSGRSARVHCCCPRGNATHLQPWPHGARSLGQRSKPVKGVTLSRLMPWKHRP